MKFNFEKKLTFLFILTTLVLVLLLIVFYNNNQKIKTTGNWVLHTQEVLRKNDKVLLDVLDIVTGPRAYFFSGDEIFLEPYYKSSKTIKGNIEELARLSMDNARQQSRIDTLKNSIEKHLIYTKKLIEIKKNSSLSETEKTVINHKGTYFTNKIRLLIDHINNEELFLLKLRKTENEKSIKKFEQLFFILLFFFLVILLLVSLVIIKNQKTRAKHEIELNKSKELFSNLFNHNPSAIVISRLKDEKIINTNNSFLELLGFSNLEEVIGKTAAELNILFSPIQREEIFQVLKENKIAKGIETTVQTKKGTILWISTFILLLKVDHESCLFSVSIDITERKKAEEQLLIANKELENYIQQLAESEEKFRVVLDSAQIGAWDLNLVKDTAWRSLLHDQIFGYDDFLPEWGYDIFIKHVIPEDRKHAEQRFAEAYSKGKFSMECRIKKADDTIRWISAQGLVYKNEKGELTKMMGIVIDITDRKNSEHQLKVITAKLKEAQTLAKVGNWDSNLVTNTDTWSDEAFKILGVDPNTTLASLDTYFSCIHPNDLAFVKEKVNEVFTTLKGNTFNHRIKRQDETIIHVLSQTNVDFDENNKPKRFFGIVQDITEIKNAEEKLIEINQELESFSYSISHDLRAPLRAINGYAQILNEDYGEKLDQEGMRILETIRSNAAKMGTLIDDLLAFSRLGRKEMQKTEVDMNQLIESVINETNKTITYKTKINTTHLHKVKADYSLLHQVMFNLVSNAIKYSSKGENPIVRISSEEKNGEIIFSVNDNGVGFDMQYSDKLFGVFQRLHSYEEFKGTGVGLAIVQRIIIKHGGKVWAEGIVNKGATFHFSLTKN